MNRKIIIDIQMVLKFGNMGRWKYLLKKAVNEALDGGEWQEGFDIAVTPHDLENDEAHKLLNAVFNAYPECIINVDNLESIINKYFEVESISWIIEPVNVVLLADTLRVGKVENGVLLWITRRISWDGIILDRVEDGIVYGSWYNVLQQGDEWQPLQLSYKDGTLLNGEIIEFDYPEKKANDNKQNPQQVIWKYEFGSAARFFIFGVMIPALWVLLIAVSIFAWKTFSWQDNYLIALFLKFFSIAGVIILGKISYEVYFRK